MINNDAKDIAKDKLAEFSKKDRLQSLYLTRKETAQLLRVSVVTLNDYCKQGLFPSYRIGRRILFKQNEVEKAVEKGLRYSHNRRGGVK